jgi:hypothetical protein
MTAATANHFAATFHHERSVSMKWQRYHADGAITKIVALWLLK